MAAIISITSLLRETGLNDIQANYTHLIDRTSHILLGLLKDIIDSSRLESGIFFCFYFCYVDSRPPSHEEFNSLETFYPVVATASLSAIDKGLFFKSSILCILDLEISFDISPELLERNFIFTVYD